MNEFTRSFSTAKPVTSGKNAAGRAAAEARGAVREARQEGDSLVGHILKMERLGLLKKGDPRVTAARQTIKRGSEGSAQANRDARQISVEKARTRLDKLLKEGMKDAPGATRGRLLAIQKNAEDIAKSKDRGRLSDSDALSRLGGLSERAFLMTSLDKSFKGKDDLKEGLFALSARASDSAVKQDLSKSYQKAGLVSDVAFDKKAGWKDTARKMGRLGMLKGDDPRLGPPPRKPLLGQTKPIDLFAPDEDEVRGPNAKTTFAQMGQSIDEATKSMSNSINSMRHMKPGPAEADRREAARHETEGLAMARKSPQKSHESFSTAAQWNDQAVQKKLQTSRYRGFAKGEE